MIKNILGYKTRVCGQMCADGFKADREQGVIYGCATVNGIYCASREEYSLAALRCAYCNAPVKGRVPPATKQKFGI